MDEELSATVIVTNGRNTLMVFKMKSEMKVVSEEGTVHGVFLGLLVVWDSS